MLLNRQIFSGAPKNSDRNSSRNATGDNNKTTPFKLFILYIRIQLGIDASCLSLGWSTALVQTEILLRLPVCLVCSTQRETLYVSLWAGWTKWDFSLTDFYAFSCGMTLYTLENVEVTSYKLWVSLWSLCLHSYLKCMGRVVHTVNPEGEAQRVAGVRTTKHSQPQPLGCILVQRLPHQGVAARMLQQHMAPLSLQQTVAGSALLVDRHHFLWLGENPSREIRLNWLKTHSGLE